MTSTRSFLRSFAVAAALVVPGCIAVTSAPAQTKPAATIVTTLTWEQASKLVSISPSTVYPASAGKATGTVKVKIKVSTTGAVTVLSATGPAVFLQAGKENAKAYHFNPYELNGKPQAFETTITIHFAPAA